jgi:ferredoxin
MCQWCLNHGEGKKWYLNTKNYITKELFDAKEEIRTASDMLFRDSERTFGIDLKMAIPHLNNPIVAAQVRSTIEKRETGQVIPLDEAKAIVNNANMAALVPCVCRQSQLGFTKPRHCLAFTYLVDYGKEWPDSVRGGVNYISIEEAKEALENGFQKGFVLSVYGFPVPFVGGICMCEYPYCLAIKGRLDYGMDYLIRKAEYVVKHDANNCVGCGECVGKCQFGAIKLSRTLETALFNPMKCFGCGVCVQACEQDAISLVPREQVPAVKDVW